MLHPSEDLLIEEAAKILHVTRAFVIRLLGSGTIPHIKVGSQFHMLLSDVIAYKEQ